MTTHEPGGTRGIDSIATAEAALQAIGQVEQKLVTALASVWDLLDKLEAGRETNEGHRIGELLKDIPPILDDFFAMINTLQGTDSTSTLTAIKQGLDEMQRIFTEHGSEWFTVSLLEQDILALLQWVSIVKNEI